MVSFKKRICPLSKRDRGISYSLGDASMFYETLATVIGRIGKEQGIQEIPLRRGLDKLEGSYATLPLFSCMQFPCSLLARNSRNPSPAWFGQIRGSCVGAPGERNKQNKQQTVEIEKNEFDPCVYKKISGSMVSYLVLYVDNISLIGNDVKILGNIKAWLSTQFSIKYMGQTSYIFGIKIYRDRSRRMLGLTQSLYIENVLKRFKMKNSKQECLSMRHGIKLSKK
ncbi:Retrovirus-related Pol polyprotein from transposon TNT 1-94 [Sesamum angolense]|uniref:Retrovirus-related Pol polyprotein from transposon TNT 1-94 n=1 Tax=Sesamum angolense TaxID=2727404 RepID=A0AAE1WJA9_9LAMI|nr:Retrovirus-related Pol polyprotein from transposon TNT 1-94 [Sesamum angolense]